MFKTLALVGLAAVACLAAVPAPAQDAAEFAGWLQRYVTGFCASSTQQSIAIQFVTYAAFTIGGASFLSNFRKWIDAYLPPWVMPVIDALALIFSKRITGLAAAPEVKAAVAAQSPTKP